MFPLKKDSLIKMSLKIKTMFKSYYPTDSEQKNGLDFNPY